MPNRNDLFDFDETTASNNDNVQGANIAENCAPSGINNAIRGLASIVKRAVGSQGNAIASAATTAIGAPGTALYTKITGATAITSFGTVAAGTLRILEFEGALTLTHNATSLILPGAANITTATGDVMLAISEGSGNWRVLNFQQAAAAATIANKPTFLAHKNGTDQTGVTSATDVKVTFGTEDWDTAGGFASSTFSPTVAGKYRLSASVNFDNTNGVDNELLTIMIYKNGSEHRRVQNRRNVAAGAQSTAISVIVDNDGNDTFEV